MILIGLTIKNQKKIIYETAVFIGCVASTLILTTVILGSPLKYFDLFLHGNVVSGHSPAKDYKILFDRLNMMLRETPTIWSYGIISMLLPVVLMKIKNLTYKILILIPWLSFAILTSYWYTPSHISTFLILGMGSPLIIGFLLIFPIYALYNKNRILSRRSIISLWMCASLIFSAVLGSDTFTERLSLPFVIPVCIAILWRIKYKAFHSYLKNVILIVMITFGSMLLMHLGRQAYIFKDYEIITLAPFNGIKSGEMYSEIEPSLNAIQFLYDHDISFLTLNDNKLAELITGRRSVVPFHEFHAFLFQKKYWLENKNRFLPFVDAVVYVPRLIRPVNDYAFIVNDIKKEGFVYSTPFGDAIILSRYELEN